MLTLACNRAGAVSHDEARKLLVETYDEISGFSELARLAKRAQALPTGS